MYMDTKVAKKYFLVDSLAQRHIGMDCAVVEDSCFHQAVDDKIVIHPAKIICEIIGNLVQQQSLATG